MFGVDEIKVVGCIDECLVANLVVGCTFVGTNVVGVVCNSSCGVVGLGGWKTVESVKHILNYQLQSLKKKIKPCYYIFSTKMQ